MTGIRGSETAGLAYAAFLFLTWPIFTPCKKPAFLYVEESRIR
jgi:hypothetical protein